MIYLTKCSFGVKQHSLTHSYTHSMGQYRYDSTRTRFVNKKTETEKNRIGTNAQTQTVEAHM